MRYWETENAFFLNSKLYFAKIKFGYCAHFNEHFMGIIGMHFKEVKEENLKGQELFLSLFNNPKQAK